MAKNRGLQMDIVERVARAICKARFLNGGNKDDDGWDSSSEAIKAEYMSEARAAIEAMGSDSASRFRYLWIVGQDGIEGVDDISGQTPS